ncbi:uncharacterized protein LOC133495626 isoform X1 [Syngnathoides biaculeatus]|uniref:uncharacterized protein LOC133495626 isoform X1 n=1 Tax=Syngnathoides biaculeatus TaxID=300417 RepID=UPI002ADE5FA4|nr:uncharacterized protein LOC133495626 isoform X1 [Syngnathoides biaculeatus]
MRACANGAERTNGLRAADRTRLAHAGPGNSVEHELHQTAAPAYGAAPGRHSRRGGAELPFPDGGRPGSCPLHHRGGHPRRGHHGHSGKLSGHLRLLQKPQPADAVQRVHHQLGGGRLLDVRDAGARLLRQQHAQAVDVRQERLRVVRLLRRPLRHLQHDDADGDRGGPLRGDHAAAGLAGGHVPQESAGHRGGGLAVLRGLELAAILRLERLRPRRPHDVVLVGLHDVHAGRSLLHHAALHLRLLHPALRHHLLLLPHLPGHPAHHQGLREDQLRGQQGVGQALPQAEERMEDGQDRPRRHPALHHLLGAVLLRRAHRLRRVCTPADPLHELRPGSDRQSVSHPQSHHLRNHAPQVQVGHQPLRALLGGAAVRAGARPPEQQQLPVHPPLDAHQPIGDPPPRQARPLLAVGQRIGPLLRHGRRQLRPSAREPAVALRRQTRAPFQPEVKAPEGSGRVRPADGEQDAAGARRHRHVHFQPADTPQPARFPRQPQQKLQGVARHRPSGHGHAHSVSAVTATDAFIFIGITEVDANDLPLRAA